MLSLFSLFSLVFLIHSLFLLFTFTLTRQMSAYKQANVLDVTSPDFDVDVYLSCQLKEKSLDELVKEEKDMVSSVRRLDSDVHQLVYENYNKFLTATSTVRKIQDEFNLLDTEMSSLSSSMSNISGLISGLKGVLGEQREDLAQLGSSYKIIKSLQSVFDLPNIFSTYFEERRYADIVRLHGMMQKSLAKYKDVPNVAEILQKCEVILQKTRSQLRETISAQSEQIDDCGQVVELLMQLEPDHDAIQKLLMDAVRTSLQNDLENLQKDPDDVLDLVDRGCGSFIPNVTLFASLHERLFPKKTEVLLEMLKEQLENFHQVVCKSFLSTMDPKDCSIVVRALDRYYRKMSTCAHVIKGLDCSSSSVSLIAMVSRHEIEVSRNRIKEESKRVLCEIRQTLLDSVGDLQLYTDKLEQAFIVQVKTALANLLLFIASDVTFSTLPPEEFQVQFANDVYDNLLIASFRDLADLALSFADLETNRRCFNPVFLLVLAATLHHLSNKSAQYLLNLCKEQFSRPASSVGGVTDTTGILKDCSHTLLKSFAQEKGMELGECLVKGCEGVQQSSSPTGVRAAIRRTVEDVEKCDRILSSLLGGDARKEQRPRRMVDTHKDSLWCDRIDFHQQIHFNKGSIITAIVKVLLKSFIECIRVQTYTRTAVEQIQVDCCYLQRCLSPLVADEVVVNSMVDQALSSALKRCLDPVLIHPSKLAHLCDEKE